MHITYIDNKTVHAAQWAQGNTMEYYIYPNDADYQNKDFLFRLSSATINEAPASFTNFMNYNRFLIMLDGYIDLEINNSRDIYAKHKLITFTSQDKVTSYTTGKDFNLMVNKSLIDCLVSIEGGVHQSNYDFIIIYALDDCKFFIDNSEHDLQENDALILENTDKINCQLICNKEFIFIQVNK